MFPTEKSPKISAKFFCENCNYKCSKQSEYNKHILTNKHKILQNPTTVINTKIYTCECGKKYKHSSTLYAHKKICDFKIKENTIEEKNEPNIDTNTELSDKNLILTLIQQNNELQKQMLEVIKNGTTTCCINFDCLNMLHSSVLFYLGY